MKLQVYIGCYIILQAILLTQQQGFPEIEFENTAANKLAWADLEEKINHQFSPRHLLVLAIFLMGNAKVTLVNGVYPNITEIIRGEYIFSMKGLTILQVSLLCDFKNYFSVRLSILNSCD